MTGLELKEQYYRRVIETLDSARHLGVMEKDVQDALWYKMQEYRKKIKNVRREMENKKRRDIMNVKKEGVKKGKEFKKAGVDHVTAMQAGKLWVKYSFGTEVAE